MANQLVLLDTLRIFLCTLILVYSSYVDLKTREVTNWIWVIFAPIGAVLNVYEQLYIGYANPVFGILIPILLSAGLGVAFFYAGLYGGADAKAFIVLAIIAPYHPVLMRPILGVTSPFFPLTLFANSAISAGLFALALLVRNLVWRTGHKGPIFEGLETEPAWKKAFALLSCIKVDSSRLRGPPFQYPAEQPTNSQRRIVLLPDTNDDEAASETLRKLTQDLGLKEVWVSPTLPFIVFISLCFLISILFGDTIFWILFQILGR